jgi:putative N-acetylmannosamine-6-phosphate epimerase
LDHEETLLRLARASVDEGVTVLRLEGLKNVRTIKSALSMPTIGLLKRRYPGSDVYITPTAQDADTMIELGCEIIAIDATRRPRPRKTDLDKLIAHIKRRKALVMADCDTLQNAILAADAGADIIGTTMAGYTPDRATTVGPDLELLREIVRAVDVPVIAEGRYSQRWEVETALRIGAAGVVVGGALNDPVKQTRALMPRVPFLRLGERPVGAIDIGGTWLRFGVFGTDWQIQTIDRTPNPPLRADRIAWIRERIEAHDVARVGIGTGGIVDPSTGEVWTAKEYLMPDHIGIRFDEETLGVPTFAHGDGHATAWGHACLPQYAGRRVATLALGTGVGCGFVENGRIWAGRRGEYPRINDLPAAGGATYEGLLGGINLTPSPSETQMEAGIAALEGAIKALRDLYFPDDIVIAGSVGLSPWLAPHLERLGAVASPFGGDAGLYGAAALALFPA